MRSEMKDTFARTDLLTKTHQFIFQCEIYSKKEEIAQSRDIQIELADIEFLSSELCN